MANYPLELGRGHVRIHAHGKPLDYQVKDFNNPGSFKRHMSLFGVRGLSAVAMPVPSFNGHVVYYRECLRKFNGGASYILTGVGADGIILEVGQAAAIASGDCPTTVIINEQTGQVACLHTGRDPLLPLNLRSKKAGTPDSVIATLLRTTRWNPKNLRAQVCVGIGPERFTHPLRHPQYGSHNQQMLRYLRREYGAECTPGSEELGRIDLFAIIRTQCERLGIAPERIESDGIDTAASEARGLWWSARRKGEKESRNIVIVENRQ